MKFMKLGSKPDSFQTEGDDIRYVASELATDLVINVGDVKFYLHKFPLLSKSARLQKLVASTNDENSDEIYIQEIPGGPAAFEICTKFCYGMVVTLNPYNVVATRCAAEYLEMYETVDKGNLIYKIEVFLNSSIFRSWKDSIIVLQTTRSLLPWSEELKIGSHCLDSIASKASIDTSKVEWSYTYNRKKLPSENGKDPNWNCLRRPQMVPSDWWVEDLCELHIDLYKRVIATIKTKGRVSNNVIGEALNAYAMRRLPGLNKGVIQSSDMMKYRSLAETIIWLLPSEKGSVPCGLTLKLLRGAILLECGEIEKNEVLGRIGQQLDTALLPDLLIQAPDGETGMYDVDIVQTIVKEFLRHEQISQTYLPMENQFQQDRDPKFASDAPKILVAKLIDGYLAEISRDPSLPLSKFLGLAEMVSRFPRLSHDGIYRAIDMYLKEHPGISKSERKKICRLMDCRKLSAEACMHAVQNERLPLRIVVQVLFFEQMRSTTPELPGGSIRSLLPTSSHGSSISTTTNTEDDWDAIATAEDIKTLKGKLATLQLERHGSNASLNDCTKTDPEKTSATKMKSLTMSKKFSRLWLYKERNGEASSSSTSESADSGSGSCSVTANETKSTPPRSRRYSVSN